MKKFYIITILAISTIIFLFIGNSKVIAEEISGEKIKLPEPVYDSKISIEKALHERRSVRSYKNEALTLSEVSQLLWSAQGITDDKGHRTAPSAMALYPLEVYIVANNIKDLPAGIYKYIPDGHEIRSIMKGDVKEQLAAAGQSSFKEAPLVIVFAGVNERITKTLGEESVKYVFMEAGHAAQNVYLQAVSLNIGTVVAAGFNSKEIKKILHMEENEEPLYVMPAGKK